MRLEEKLAGKSLPKRNKDEKQRSVTSGGVHEQLSRRGYAVARCSITGDQVCLARDDVSAVLPAGVAVYWERELELLFNREAVDDEEFKALHESKKLFPGSEFVAAVVPWEDGQTAEETQQRVLQLKLMALARKRGQRKIATYLEAFFRMGTEIRELPGKGFVLRPRVGDGAWESEEDYAKERDRWLRPHLKQVKKLLEELMLIHWNLQSLTGS